MPVLSQTKFNKMEVNTSYQVLKAHSKSTNKSYGTYAHLFYFKIYSKYSKYSNN